ncbi:hypothetical protein [Undibacterium umbellatum]|uniref:Uncharacterized protein n=1 Tax=Undibacterium umbellatum TaxID=2762300 RepID=A0ABR6Z328_9BURK|nr:hypothetical protein [Undibacterium umbellatum]MBC3906180.1 hypothetical protein [Undibacterium umbellatum]
MQLNKIDMAKNNSNFGVTLVISLVAIIGFGIASFSIFPNVLAKIGKDATDAEQYAARVSAQIKDTKECSKYKEQLKDLGKSAQTINGGFTYRVVEVKNEVNKAGCNK